MSKRKGMDWSDEVSLSDEDADGSMSVGFVEHTSKRPVVRGRIQGFEVLSLPDIVAKQNANLCEIRDMTGIDLGRCRILLRHYNWNTEKLQEKLFDDPERALREVHLALPSEFTPTLPVECGTCMEELTTEEETAFLTCHHIFCRSCWSEYLSLKINEEGQKAGLVTCMAHKCRTPVDEAHVARLVSQETYNKYMRFLLDDYIKGNSKLTWCPLPGCEKCISIKSEVRGAVKCDRGEWWCFTCKEPSHQPATCEMVKAWKKKCTDDSETYNWLSFNTKDCPSCKKVTEKNGGCNHISCVCGAHWCWMCNGVFDSRSVYQHSCNAFDDRAAFDDDKLKARASLDRYLHYFTRFGAHDQSKQKESDIARNMQLKMDELIKTDGSTSWIDVRYLEESIETLFECRDNLKWTYVFAFYFFDSALTEKLAEEFRPFASKEEAVKAKDQFEFHQLGLESTTEQLSKFLEMPVATIVAQENYRLTVINLATTARKKFDAMFDIVDWIRTKGATGSWFRLAAEAAAKAEEARLLSQQKEEKGKPKAKSKVKEPPVKKHKSRLFGRRGRGIILPPAAPVPVAVPTPVANRSNNNNKKEPIVVSDNEVEEEEEEEDFELQQAIAASLGQL